MLPVGREAETFEPIDQVVGKQNQMEIGLIGSPISGGDFSQGIGFEKFPDDKLPCGSLVVKAPEMEGFQRKVCNDHLVGIPSHLEKRELPGGFLWNETANDDESLGRFPSPGFVFELRGPESRGDFFVMEASKVVLDGFGNPSHNGIEGRNFLKELDNRMVVEGRIGPHPDLSNSRGKLQEVSFQKLYGMGSGMNISRQIDALPEISGFAFEAEKGLIRGSSPFPGIVTHSGSFLLTIDRKNLGIEIEDHRREGIGFHQEITSESIVEFLEGGKTLRSKTPQESPQGRWIGISGKTGHKLEVPILFQEDVGFDSTQSQDHWVKDSKDGVADRVTVVELREPNRMGKEGAKSDPLEKLL